MRFAQCGDFGSLATRTTPPPPETLKSRNTEIRNLEIYGRAQAQASKAESASSTSRGWLPVNCACCLSIPKPSETRFLGTSSERFARRLKIASSKQVKKSTLNEELGLKLLQSVREMKARNFARVTEVAPNEVTLARQGTGMSQTEFAAALSISKRT